MVQKGLGLSPPPAGPDAAGTPWRVREGRPEGRGGRQGFAGLEGGKGVSQIHEPVFKRPFDLLLSGAGLLLSLPLWGLFALLIWLEDGSPIFFRQERIGRNGRMFIALKFRSMIKDPGQVERQATKDDRRITRVGRLLRMTAMDELPQIWNIFLGDMSFVGPRSQPEKERVIVSGREEDVYIRQVPGYELRQLVRPGLTGITQLYAPREVLHRQKFRYDLIYVKRVLQNARLHTRIAQADRRGFVPRIPLRGRALLGDLRMFAYDLGLILRSVWITVTGKWEV